MLNLDNIFNKFYPKSQTAGTGRKLYIMAWAIEIFVAMVGLTMAYIFFQKQYERTHGATRCVHLCKASNPQSDTIPQNFGSFVFHMKR